MPFIYGAFRISNMEKIKIGGIKLSHPLTLLRLGPLSETAPSARRLVRCLADARVNICFLAVNQTRAGRIITAAVAREDYFRAQQACTWNPQMAGELRTHTSVGLLSLYPTKMSLEITGIVLSALSEAGLPIHAMGSSLSTMNCILDYESFDQAVAALTAKFELPPGHAPMRPQLRVRQTDQTRRE
jgi:aspartokinase